MTFGFNIYEDQDSYKSRAKCMKIIISERQYLMDEDHYINLHRRCQIKGEGTDRSAYAMRMIRLKLAAVFLEDEDDEEFLVDMLYRWVICIVIMIRILSFVSDYRMSFHDYMMYNRRDF